MPERSEWLVAEGGAKRNPRYRDAHCNAFEKREYHLLWRPFSRPPDAFLGDDGFPGVALTLNPRLRALGLRPRRSTFQVGYPPQPITAARPERSNARAERVARSRGWSEA